MDNKIIEQTTASNISRVPKVILKSMLKNDSWIAAATTKKGGLRIKAKKAITKAGKINKQFLKKNSRGNSKLAKQSRLALTLSKFKKK